MRKMIVLITVALALLGLVSGASAQTTPIVYCSGLTDEDCAILTDSAAAMMALESAAFDFSLDVNLSNIPESPFEALDFRLTGDGSYMLDAEGLNPALFSPDQLMSNLDQLPELFESAIKAVDAEMDLVLFLPSELVQITAGSGTRLPDKAGLSLKLVDGFGYVNLEKLAELDLAGQIPTGWLGMDVATLYRRVLEQSLTQLDSMNMDMGDMMSGFMQPDFIGQYVTVERLADADADGQNAAVFQMDFDLDGLYSSPEFEDYMRQQFAAMMSQAGSTGASDEAMLEQMLTMMSSIYDGITLQMTQTIGLDDKFVRSTTMTMDWPLDFGAMFSAMGAGSEGVPTEPLNISIIFEAGLTDFNAAPAITAPEDAQIAPLDDLMPAL